MRIICQMVLHKIIYITSPYIHKWCCVINIRFDSQAAVITNLITIIRTEQMKFGCDHSYTFWTIHGIFPMTLGWQTIINTFSLIKSILLHSTHSVLNRNKITFAKAICQKAKVFHVLFKLWKFTFLKLSNTLCIAYI